MHLLLHVGTEQTGAANWQKVLFHYRSQLAESKLWYSASMGAPFFPANHRKLIAYARPFSEKDDSLEMFGIQSADAQVKFREKTREKLENEVMKARENGADVFFLSCEHAHSRLTKPEWISELKTLFDGLFENVTVLFHLRPQIDMAISAITNSVLFGQPLSRASFNVVKPSTPYYDYLGMVKKWASVFGISSIRLSAFKNDVFPLKGMDAGPASIESDIIENAEDSLTMGLDLSMIEAVMSVPDLRTRHIQYFQSYPVHTPLRLGIDRATKLQAAFFEDNAQLATRYQGLKASDLTPDWAPHMEASNFDQINPSKETGRLIEHMLERSRMVLLRQKAETHLTECERALARNNVDIARNFYASFERALNESTPEFERLRLSPDIKNRMLECKQKVS